VLKVKSGFSPEEVRRAISSYSPWYHRIELLPEISTPGMSDTMEALSPLNLPENCQGLRVLDLGAADGFYSILLEQRGASVVAIDHRKPEQTGFHVLRGLCDSHVDWRTDNVYNVSFQKYGHFDIVLCMGLLYHLRNPLLALERIREVCRDRLCVESHVIDYDLPELGGLPVAMFYQKDELNKDVTNWWGPSSTCLRAMLESTNFTVLDKKTIGNRVTFLCRVNSDSETEYFRKLESGLVSSRLRLFSLANFRKYLWYCRLYGLKNATKLAFRRLKKRNTTLRRAYKVSDDSK
jgi:tRNA (mo5U34)-methyltransferase